MPKRRKNIWSRLFQRGFLLAEIAVLLPVLLVIASNLIIRLSTEGHLYDTLDELPRNRVALVLGTSHRVRDGGPNPYFHNRMAAAAALFHNGKVDYLLVSGDNRSKYYNEPFQMRSALMEMRVPPEAIYSDKAGLRTLDSVLRAKMVFGLDSVTIVSQRFHNQRAIYIARRHGLEAVAFNAADAPHHSSDRTRVREWFAKTNVFWDMLTGKQPARLEERTPIGVTAAGVENGQERTF